MIPTPQQAPPRKQRVSLGLKVTSEIKHLIDSTARASGRTQSQEAEYLIELALNYRRALGEFESRKEALRNQQREIERGNIEVVLRRLNWQKRHDPKTGQISWIPPDQHGLPPSGFILEEHPPAEEKSKAALDPRIAAAFSVLMDALTEKGGAS